MIRTEILSSCLKHDDPAGGHSAGRILHSAPRTPATPRFEAPSRMGTRGGRQPSARRRQRGPHRACHTGGVQPPLPVSGAPAPPRKGSAPLRRVVTWAYARLRSEWPDRFAKIEGQWRPEHDAVLARFGACGDVARGSATFRCVRPSCGETRVVAFPCHTRQFCPSCAARRARSVGLRLAAVADPRVPHRQVVFTIPRLLRPFLRRSRALLDLLFDAAGETLRGFLTARTDCTDGVIGAFVALQTFGQDLSWHPHLHVLVADGVFLRDGTFVVAPEGGGKELEARFVAAMRRRLDGHVPDHLLRLLASWRHTACIDRGEIVRHLCAS